MPVDPTTVRIIAVDGGKFVRVCPYCDARVEETSEEIEPTYADFRKVNDDPRLKALGLKSYDTVVHHDGIEAHLQDEHIEDEDE